MRYLLDQIVFKAVAPMRVDVDNLGLGKPFNPFRTIKRASFSAGSPKMGTLTFAQSVESCLYAPGLKVSAQITPTFSPFRWKYRASFDAVVGLPLPCSPAIRIVCCERSTFAARRSVRASSCPGF